MDESINEAELRTRFAELLLKESVQWEPGGNDMGESSQASRRTMHPVLLVQEKYGGMGPHPPCEVFTEDDPPILVKSIDFDNDPIPIDDLLGLYDPVRREIKIFVKTINHVASVMQMPSDDLEYKVRLHELGHALVHLGLNHVPTSWEEFLDDRLRFFGRVDRRAHEVLAQLIAWTLLGDNIDLKATFRTLMSRQPPEYQLNEMELGATPKDVTRVLLYVRDDYLTRSDFQLGTYAGVRTTVRFAYEFREQQSQR